MAIKDRLLELAEAARTLEPSVLAELCTLLYPEMFRYFAYRVARREDAEDLTSELFLRMLRAITKQRGNFLGWTYRIAENLLTDFYRRRSVRSGVIDESVVVESVTADSADASKDALQYEIRLAMKQLTPEQYQVVILRFIEGRSSEETAARIGSTVGAVKALQFRALEKIRAYFKDGQHDEHTA